METAVAFLFSLDLPGFVAVFWFYLLFDLPRYALSTLVVGWQALFTAPEPLPDPTLPVSVLMAGHNEGDKLARAARGLREQTHANLEIVVVDDGSTDDTRAVAQQLLAEGMIEVFLATGLRGGKASAMNLGLQGCSHDFLVVMDVDTSLDRDAVAQAVAPLVNDPTCGGASGSLGVRNSDDSLLTRLQAMEYTITITLSRQFTAMFDILTIVSGGFGAFRRSAVEMVGGWDSHGGEDANLTYKLRRAGWRIAHNPDAWALTDVPATASAFARQRLRWNYDIIGTWLRKFRVAFDPRQSNFTVRDVVASINVVWFHFGLSVAFIFYIFYLFFYYEGIFVTVLIAVHIVLFASDLVQFAVAAIAVRRLPVLSWLPYLPAYVLFTGYFKRGIRLKAYIDELVFRRSSADPYYPTKVRKAQDQF